ncbi:hypothetical protein Tco_0401880, partial [Tanacetum coccineum]
MALVAMKNGGWWCKKHADGDDDGYLRLLEGNGVDVDGDYDYAPAASEGD